MNLLVPTAEANGGEFSPPSIDEFFPEIVLFDGTPFAINRIMLVRFVAVIVLLLVFWLGTRRMRVVPGRFQGAIEWLLRIPRQSIAYEILGERDGKRFLPLLTTLFFTILFMNFTGLVPLLNIAGTSVIGVPLLFAVVAWVTFMYAGIRHNAKGFFKNALFPPGVPVPLYVIVTPIELVSTFIVRPITLSLRLLMNMMVGHLLLVLMFSATWFFVVALSGWWTPLGAGTLLFGFAITAFEALVAMLQAYIFTLLAAVYIQLAVADEH